jgi:hypothetical protein
MRYPAFYGEEPEQVLGCWRTRCLVCDWEEDETHVYQDDCETEECPACGSTHIKDINEDD